MYIVYYMYVEVHLERSALQGKHVYRCLVPCREFKDTLTELHCLNA